MTRVLALACLLGLCALALATEKVADETASPAVRFSGDVSGAYKTLYSFTIANNDIDILPTAAVKSEDGFAKHQIEFPNAFAAVALTLSSGTVVSGTPAASAILHDTGSSVASNTFVYSVQDDANFSAWGTRFRSIYAVCTSASAPCNVSSITGNSALPVTFVNPISLAAGDFMFAAYFPPTPSAYSAGTTHLMMQIRNFVNGLGQPPVKYDGSTTPPSGIRSAALTFSSKMSTKIDLGVQYTVPTTCYFVSSSGSATSNGCSIAGYRISSASSLYEDIDIYTPLPSAGNGVMVVITAKVTGTGEASAAIGLLPSSVLLSIVFAFLVNSFIL